MTAANKTRLLAFAGTARTTHVVSASTRQAAVPSCPVLAMTSIRAAAQRKTFAGAFSKTFINGEIDCLDPGGYGALTITKSITLDCTGTFGSILASGTTGISINIAVNANDPFRTVRIRGLSINGTGASGTIGTRTIRASPERGGGRDRGHRDLGFLAAGYQ